MVTHKSCSNKIIPGHQCPQQGGPKQESEYNFSVVVGYSDCKIIVCFMANQGEKKIMKNNKSILEWCLPKLQLIMVIFVCIPLNIIKLQFIMSQIRPYL